MLSYPLALVADDEPVNLRFLERALTLASWRVMVVDNGGSALEAAIAQAPHVVVLDINMPVLDGWQTAARLRALNTPAAGAPILAFTTEQVGTDELRRRGFDGHVPKPCSEQEVVAALARWRPRDELSGVERLATVFDPTELDRLAGRLRDQLVAAINADPIAVAHRIAGAAGTLGFMEVSESWLALSEGNDSVRARALADARRAIAAIDRRVMRTVHAGAIATFD